MNNHLNLSIVVPAINESKNLPVLFERIYKTFIKTNIKYEIIVIDDRSSDNSVELVNALAHKYQVVCHVKKGKPGKAFSILEGASYAKSDLIAMIDADLQYPPEILPKMYVTAKNGNTVVAYRQTRHESYIRTQMSKINKFFMRLLTGIDTDIQSGLKVFSSSIVKNIDINQVTPWTLDLLLLGETLKLGQKITQVPITFSERASGTSNINLLSSTFEILLATLKYRFYKTKYSYFSGSIEGKNSGVHYKSQKYITHSNLAHQDNALEVFVSWQKVFIYSIVVVFVSLIILYPLPTIIIFMAFISILHFVDMIMNLFLIGKSLSKTPEITFRDEEILALDENLLPTYTILCPLYKEAHILPYFLASMEKLDYPKEKLEVMLLLEEDDQDSISKIKLMQIPTYVNVVVVPHSLPKTKPKACNYGLQQAKGEYIVIYDAEDMPDPLQLKKAVIAFASVGPKTFCLQAKLNYYNPYQNWLTRFFTAEYSLWFDAILPGLQSIKTLIPLGGTSNHFRRADLIKLHGWDAFNVTEDCDLGMRIFRRGYKTAIIDSVTLEEANSDFKNWLRQRSRWIKGYMQTYLIQMRRPLVLWREDPLHFFLFQLTIGGKIFSLFINPLLWIMTISYFAFRSQIGVAIESIFPGWVFYLALTSLVAGNFLYLYYYMIGSAKHKEWGVIKWSLFVPIYWLMISISAFIALQQLIFKPHYWEKTLHGLHLLPTNETKSTIKIVKREKTSSQVPIWHIPSYNYFFKSITLSLVGIYLGYLIAVVIGIVPTIVYINILVGSSLVFAIYFYRSLLISRNDSHEDTKEANEIIKSRKMRILIMNWRDTKHIYAGGAEVYLHSLAKMWVKMGHEVTLLCGNDGSLAKHEMIDGVKMHRGGFHHFNKLWSLAYLFSSKDKKKNVYIDGLVYIFAFWNYMRHYRGKCDIIIDSQNGLPFFTPLYAKEPVVVLMHHVHQEVFRKSLPTLLANVAVLLEKLAMSVVYRKIPYIVVSDSTKNDIINNGWAKENQISIVHPGVDLNSFKMGKKSKTPLVLFVGRLTYYKSVNIFLKMAAILLEKNPNINFVIAGDGDMKKSLVKFAKKLRITNNVTFTGYLSEAEKIKYYQKAWVFVNPSFMEGWGITNIESNACGTPVVASNVSGIRNSVSPNKSGFLVRYGDYESFAFEVAKIINDSVLRAELEKESQKWARNFEWQQSADLAIECIESIRQNRNNYMVSNFAKSNLVT